MDKTIENLFVALEWALEHIEDSLDPDHQAALEGAWKILCKAFVRPNMDKTTENLIVALEWALEQIEDSLDPDHQAALESAWKILNKAKGE